MKKSHTSPRLTGNKTVTQPKSVNVNRDGTGHTSIPKASHARGYHKLGTIPVHTPPTAEPNNKP